MQIARTDDEHAKRPGYPSRVRRGRLEHSEIIVPVVSARLCASPGVALSPTRRTQLLKQAYSARVRRILRHIRLPCPGIETLPARPRATAPAGRIPIPHPAMTCTQPRKHSNKATLKEVNYPEIPPH